MRRIVTCALLVSLAPLAGAARAAGDAPRQVRAGVEQYEAGQFKEAAETFAQAREAQPDDLRVTFDLACAKAAAGETDEAVELLRKASVAKDPALAARCHYNLGQIAIERARAALGPKPEEAAPEARSQAAEAIEAAEGHWRDCLAADPGHEDARHNLELARLWRDKMETTWKERDRQKRRDSMDLAQFLDWLGAQQRELRGSTKELAGLPKSPKQRLAFHRAKLAEWELGEEIEPLEQKIVQAFSAPPGRAVAPPPAAAAGPAGAAMPTAPAGGAPPTLAPEDRKRAIDVLSQLASSAGESIRTASEHLAEQSTTEARRAQADAIEKLDQIATVPRPYPELVQQSVQKQEGLVNGVSPGSARPAQGSAATPNARPAGESKPDQDAQPAGAPPTEAAAVDLPETAWEQRFVERWAEIMVGKAKQGLKSLPPAPPELAAATEPPAAATNPPKPDPTAPAERKPSPERGPVPGPGASPDNKSAAEPTGPADPQQPAAEAARRQQEGLRKSMELAVKLGPKVQELTAQAAADLDEGRRAEALPKQQEVLRLLREIAKPLQQPNQNQQRQNQQQQQQNQQQNQDQKNQDKNQDQKKDQDKQNQDQSKSNQKKDDQDKKDKEKQDPQDKDQSKSDQNPNGNPRNEKAQEQPQQAKPRDLSKEQAEALMRQVRQRQREKDEAEKAIQLYLSRPENVEKDW